MEYRKSSLSILTGKGREGDGIKKRGTEKELLKTSDPPRPDHLFIRKPGRRGRSRGGERL